MIMRGLEAISSSKSFWLWIICRVRNKNEVPTHPPQILIDIRILIANTLSADFVLNAGFKNGVRSERIESIPGI